MSNPQAKVWLARAGKKGQDEDVSLEQGLAVIEFRKIPDLRTFESLEDLARYILERQPQVKERAAKGWARQAWMFAREINEGDIVAVPLKRTRGMVALGRCSGPYEFREIDGEHRHVRPVNWERPDTPRTVFRKDMLQSLGAMSTVCRIHRNEAEARFAAIIQGHVDPGSSDAPSPGHDVAMADSDRVDDEAADRIDLIGTADDEIVAAVRARFVDRRMEDLVAAILGAQGYDTEVAPPGADGGVDILAGRGGLGLEMPQLVVQVKAWEKPAAVDVFRALQGSMQTFKADRGLLVCWGGFTREVRREARTHWFNIRLWSASELVDAIKENYEGLPEDIKAELPLQRVWVLVDETG